MGIVEQLTEAIKSVPTLEACRERLEFARDQLKAAQSENESLKKINAELRRQLASLRAQSPSSAWVEARGAYFKRKADGTFEPDAYCTKCKTPLSSTTLFAVNGHPMRCSRCKGSVNFTMLELGGIVAGLED